MADNDTKMRLRLIAAKAEQLANDVGHLWPGQLEEGLREIREQLDRCQGERNG